MVDQLGRGRVMSGHKNTFRSGTSYSTRSKVTQFLAGHRSAEPPLAIKIECVSAKSDNDAASSQPVLVFEAAGWWKR